MRRAVERATPRGSLRKLQYFDRPSLPRTHAVRRRCATRTALDMPMAAARGRLEHACALPPAGFARDAFEANVAAAAMAVDAAEFTNLQQVWRHAVE